MNKADKRQRSIRNKLMAAVAMLLVASIMTVTTTYAWFTLSTAPEVQGITTTVGANGNLEIALAYPNGDNSQITSDVGDANLQSWVAKNLTWGNLLNLEDASYRLDEIALLPSRLNISDGTDTTPDQLSASPLAIPVYGTDGRISELDEKSVMYGAIIPADFADASKGFLDGFRVVNGYPGYGVRALGTSNSMSETELAFRNALNAIASGRSSANITASKALETYGSALADIAIMHANAGSGDANNYFGYVDDLTGLVTELGAASKAVEGALLNALIAIANANIPWDDGDASTNNTTIGDIEITTGQTVRQYMNGDTVSLTAAWDAIQKNDTVKSLVDKNFPKLAEAYNLWEDSNTKLNNTQTKLTGLAADPDQNIGWSEISNALYELMNIDNVTINGMTVDQLKNDKEAAQKLMGGVALQMNSGSGVLANFGALTGNLSAQVYLGKDAEYSGQSLANLPIDLVTTTEPADGPLLNQIRATINGFGYASDGSSATTVIDVTYGYVLDFVFRTNAANSNLLLQTSSAQRVYSDSENLATMGAGSTMKFNGSYSNLDSLINMMSGIRVVFQSTTSNAGSDVHGIAKVVFDDTELKLKLVPATLDSYDADSSDAGVKFVMTTTQAAEAQATVTPVYVTVTEDAKGNLSTAICLNPDKHQYLVKETVEDTANNTTYERWTIKTAMWYTEVSAVIVQDATGKDVTTYVEKEVELTNANGVIFYPEKTLVEADGKYTAWTEALKTTAITAAAPTNVVLDADRDAKTAEIQTVAAGVLAHWTADAEPKYYHVYDEDNANISLEGTLYLHEYDIGENGLVFRGPKAVQILTGLDQNVATGVSAMVYLDGDYVDNSDVTNSENGISNTGTLNLQFASSATLVPMENTDLKNGESVAVNWVNNTDATYAAQEMKYAIIDQDYVFALDKDYTATVTFAKEGVEAVTLTGDEKTVTVGDKTVTGYQFTIPAASITKDNGAITITITEPTANP